MRINLGIGVLALCAAWTAQLSPALAAPGWTAPANYPVPANAAASTVHIGYASGGIATVAYLEIVSTSPVQTVLHVGVIPPGGSYQEQLRIPSTSTLLPADVNLAEAPDGAAVVQWASLQGSVTSPYTYFASYRPAGSGSWESPTTLFTDSTTVSGINEYLAPAISTDGTAAAGIDHVDPTMAPPGGYRVDVAVHPAGGVWGATTHISPTSQTSENLSLGFDAHGNLTAAFRVKTTTRYTMEAVTRPASNGIWGSLQDITGSDSTSDVDVPVLAVGPDGTAVIAFQYVHYAGSKTLDVNAVTRSGQNGSWTSVADVAAGGASSAPRAAGISPTDKAYILYSFQGTNSGLDCEGMVRAQVGGSFSSPQCVSPTNFGSGAYGGIAFLGNDAYFAWSGQPNGGSQNVVQGSRWLDSGAQPETAINLEQPTSTGLVITNVVGDQDGSVAAFWYFQNTLRAAAFDAGGPNLVAAGVPASAVAGQPVSMSATYADLWSGLAGTSWNFGDGSTGSGAQVSHTYAQPGTYTVTVTATDALGNQTTNTYSVAVTAPPPPPPKFTAPKLSAVGQTARRWRESRPRHHVHGKQVPVGTAFRFTLDQPATVTLAFTKSAPGRRVAGRCVASTKKNRHKHACRRTIGVGRLTVTGKKGANKLSFKGSLPKHGKLPPGTYSVTITATNSAHQSSKPATLTFTIVA